MTCCPCSPLSFLFCFLSLPLLPFTFALPLPLLSPCPGLGLPDGFLPALALSLPGWLPPHTWGALRGDLGKLRGALGGTLFSLWVSKFEKCSGCVCASGLPSFLHLCPRCPCFGEALVSPACQGLCFIQWQVIPVFLLHLGVPPPCYPRVLPHSMQGLP